MHYFLRTYKMNANIHHFSIKLHVLGRTTHAQLPGFPFIAWNSRAGHRLCANDRESPEICRSWIVYRWWFVGDLETENLANLVRVGSLSCQYLCELSKGTNLICRSLSYLCTLSAVILCTIRIFLYSTQ